MYIVDLFDDKMISDTDHSQTLSYTQIEWADKSNVSTNP